MTTTKLIYKSRLRKIATTSSIYDYTLHLRKYAHAQYAPDKEKGGPRAAFSYSILVA
jgi:hypothetical protein